MKGLVSILLLLAPVCGFCADSATLVQASAASSTIAEGACLVPGMACTKLELEKEVASIRAEMDRVGSESAKVGSQMKKPGKEGNRRQLEVRQGMLQSRLGALKRVECRLRKMREYFKDGATVFTVPSH